MSYTPKVGAKNANQRTIIIQRTIPEKGGKQPFLMVYSDVITQASRNLGGGVSFKLFIYLLSNQNGFSLDYSPQHFANLYGVHLDSAKKSVTTLIDAGYLTRTNTNTYMFSEYPVLAKPNLQSGRRVVHLYDDKGKEYTMSLQDLIEHYDGDKAAAQEAWDYAAEMNGGIYNEQA